MKRNIPWALQEFAREHGIKEVSVTPDLANPSYMIVYGWRGKSCERVLYVSRFLLREPWKAEDVVGVWKVSKREGQRLSTKPQYGKIVARWFREFETAIDNGKTWHAEVGAPEAAWRYPASACMRMDHFDHFRSIAGVLVIRNPDTGGTAIVGSDTYRMHVSESPQCEGPETPFIVPAPVAKELGRIQAPAIDYAYVEPNWEEEKAIFNEFVLKDDVEHTAHAMIGAAYVPTKNVVLMGVCFPTLRMENHGWPKRIWTLRPDRYEEPRKPTITATLSRDKFPNYIKGLIAGCESIPRILFEAWPGRGFYMAQGDPYDSEYPTLVTFYRCEVSGEGVFAVNGNYLAAAFEELCGVIELKLTVFGDTDPLLLEAKDTWSKVHYWALVMPMVINHDDLKSVRTQIEWSRYLDTERREIVVEVVPTLAGTIPAGDMRQIHVPIEDIHVGDYYCEVAGPVPSELKDVTSEIKIKYTTSNPEEIEVIKQWKEGF